MDCAYVAQWIIAVGMVLAVVRVLRGPGIADRVIALDLFASLILCQVLILAVKTGRVLFFDIAIVIALVGFLATLAFARYLDVRVGKEEQEG